MLHDKMLPKHAPGFLANAIEFRKDFIPTQYQNSIMQKLYKYQDMEDFKPNLNKKGQDKYNRKYLCVVASYMMRLPEGEDKCFDREREEMLKLAPHLLEMFWDAAKEIQQAVAAG